MPAPDAASVEVAYALPTTQRVVRLPLRPGMTAREAVDASGLVEQFPELAGQPLVLGIYGRRVEGAERLRDGDRVEIYRPLAADPREARRAAARSAGRGPPARGRPVVR